jgi:hypothetical protein
MAVAEEVCIVKVQIDLGHKIGPKEKTKTPQSLI